MNGTWLKIRTIIKYFLNAIFHANQIDSQNAKVKIYSRFLLNNK